MPKSVYLIDGHAQIYRAYYARFGNLSSPGGEPTRATHVFFQMLLNLIRDRKPDYLAVTLDVSDSTVFRKDIYPEYKAHRDPPPEDMPVQHDRIVSILEAARVPILRLEGFEADDIMATLARRFEADGFEAFLVSKDKDLEQLLSDRVRMYDPGKDEVITPESLLETKGWRPDQAIEVQSLTGDTVDNVPGVKGIGPKTAAKLIQTYGSAAAVIEHADELTPKQRENVLAFAPQLEVSRKLVTLRTDVPIELDLESAARSAFDWVAVAPVFNELGFKRLLDQLPESDGGASKSAAPQRQIAMQASLFAEPVDEVPTGTYELIDSAKALDKLAADLKRAKAFAVDTETTSVNAIDAELVGLSFSWETGGGCYVPTLCAAGGYLPLKRVRERLAPALARTDALKVGHNLKYDLIVLRNAGMPVAGPMFDTMIAAFVLDPMQTSYKMDRIIERLLGHSMIPISALIGKGRDQRSMDQVPLPQICEYAAEDADYTWRMYELFEPQLKDSHLSRLFYDVEMPLVAVLAEMEFNGISIDADFLEKMGSEMRSRIDAIRDEVHTLAKRPFNLDSPKQLGEVLFDELKFRVIRKTKTGRSTDADTLQTLADETDHELPRKLLEYRELQKLLGTYVDALPLARAKKTQRIHTSYHQTGAITGRLSSSEPNLQNIPVRTETGRQIRRAFVPRDETDRLIVADYSQIELRVLAHFCGDAELIRAFREDRDIHAFVAAQINGVDIKDVTSKMRSRAKTVNFGIVYGQGAFGLAQQTGMTRNEAQTFIDDYFRRYPNINGFIHECIKHAERHGYVETILGRRRPLPEITSRNRNARSQAERLAVNTVIQGSAADLIKIAMIKLDQRIREEELPLRMLLQVHDELVCESPQSDADKMAEVVRDVMQSAMELSVPLKVDIETAGNWLEAK